MQLQEYIQAPFSLQYIKYFNYVRVFNSEPFLYVNQRLNRLITPCCGFKSVFLNYKYNLKNIKLYDISPAQILFYKTLIKKWNGRTPISDFVIEFKQLFSGSIFKTDVKNFSTDFYNKKFNEMIFQYFQTKENFYFAWDKFLSTDKEILKLDITKNFYEIEPLNNTHYSLSNILDFEVASCLTTLEQRKTTFKECLSHLSKGRASVFEFKFLNYNGIHTNNKLRKIIKTL